MLLLLRHSTQNHAEAAELRQTHVSDVTLSQTRYMYHILRQQTSAYLP